ncbi:hypothetical protein P9112_006462 [Eukaryota sp. TZLM1-RC]
MKKLEHERSDLLSQLTLTQEQFTRKCAEIEEIEEEKFILKGKLNEMSKKFVQFKKNNNNQSNKLKAQLVNVHQQLRSAQAHQDQLQERNEFLSTELQRALKVANFEELNQREAKIKELEAEFQSFKASVFELQGEYSGLCAVLQANETEILDISNKSKEEINKLDQQRLAEISVLDHRKQEEISQLKSLYEKNLDQVFQRESEGVQKIYHLETELLEVGKSFTNVNHDLINAQKELENTRNLLYFYESEAESLKTQLAYVNQQLQAHLDHSNQRINILQSEIQTKIHSSNFGDNRKRRIESVQSRKRNNNSSLTDINNKKFNDCYFDENLDGGFENSVNAVTSACAPEQMCQEGQKSFNDKDHQEAFCWFQGAAEAGNRAAMYYLGCCIRNGKCVDQDHQQAFHKFKKGAEAGNARAMVCLGQCYCNGHGVEQDYSQAVFYCQKAAELGDRDGMCNLGVFYEHGYSVPKDLQLLNGTKRPRMLVFQVLLKG